MKLKCLGGHWYVPCRCQKCEATIDGILETGMPCGFRHTWAACKHCGKKRAPY